MLKSCCTDESSVEKKAPSTVRLFGEMIVGIFWKMPPNYDDLNSAESLFDIGPSHKQVPAHEFYVPQLNG